MKALALAFKLLFRDYRSGELSLLFLALIIAVTSVTAISLLADRLQQTMVTQAAEFLAADLVVNSTTPISADIVQMATGLNLQQAQSIEFTSVIMENEQLLLAGVKAVSNNYPLRGQLKTSLSDYATEQIQAHGPERNTVWVEKRILSALNLKLGEQLRIGEKALTISHVLTYEPDKRGDLYSLSPRAMLNTEDLAATQVIQPGSHIHYFWQFAGAPEALAQFKQQLKPLLNPSQKLMDIHEDRPEIGGALQRAERYLGLSSIVIVLIAGVTIAMSTRRYSERHLDTAALLRCLGSTQAQILTLFTWQIILLGVLASSVGCGLGWLLQDFLLHLLASLLPQKIAAPSLLSIVFGLLMGIIILLGFALPPLLQLRKVSALRVLRRDLEPLPASAWLVYGLAISLLSVLIWQYTHDLRMTATIGLSGVAGFVLLYALAYGLLTLLKPLLPKLSLAWRLSLQNLVQERSTSISQILAFSMALMVMQLSYTVKSDLIDNWQQQLPVQAPNHFALNIFPEQVHSVEQDIQLATQGNSHFYPIVRGRLTAINDVAVQRYVTKDSQGQQATERDLSLTWSESLPPDNTLVSGNWWQDKREGVVSVEQKLAENLGIKMGDRLTFTVGSEQFTAQVSSLRQVHWETMQPNFYMIFAPGNLERFAHTFLTSFYLAPAQKAFLNTLVKNYPSITVLEVDQILAQLKTILTQLTTTINYLFSLGVLAGFTVLFAAITASLDQRKHKSAIMRTLGANSRLLNTIHCIEFAGLGLISGILAVCLAESVTWVLYHFVMHLEYHSRVLLWVLIPLSASGVIAAAGYFGLLKVSQTTPMQILRSL